jgi:UDP-hydrolysing UDP-N-acetyl-D-glucosamine 2-epimerase
MPRILSVSSNRADFSILLPVWREILGRADCDLHIMLTGSHAVSGFAADFLPAAATVHRGGSDLGGMNAARASAAMSEILRDAGAIMARSRPDVVLVMGDRMDMLPAATAALPLNLPLAHLHGGEITEGAVDDRIRHAITKLSHLHFVSHFQARERLIAMGEPENRIHVTGAPGLDTLMMAPVMPRDEFFARVGFASFSDRELRLVTVHPETNASKTDASLQVVLAALHARPGLTLFTDPNSDPGGAAMLETIAAFVRDHPETRLSDTLGPSLYPNALRYASVMIGNSSSGIIEAGLFGLPVIDVGDRQRGREHSDNVVHVPSDRDAILSAIDRFDPAVRYPASSLYGDGKAAPKISSLLANLPPASELLQKPFRGGL